MKRIRRHDRDPVFPDQVAKAHKILPAAFEGECLRFRHHRTGWRRLSYEMEGIKQRRTAALIFTDERHVESLVANEFRAATIASTFAPAQ